MEHEIPSLRHLGLHQNLNLVKRRRSWTPQLKNSAVNASRESDSDSHDIWLDERLKQRSKFNVVDYIEDDLLKVYIWINHFEIHLNRDVLSIDDMESIFSITDQLFATKS